MTRLTESIKQALAQEYLDGAELDALARAYHLDGPPDAAAVLAELGVPQRTDADADAAERAAQFIADVCADYKAGKSVRAISRATGRGYGTVHRILTDHLEGGLRPRGAPSVHRANADAVP